ncbi:MAG: transporter substrate-binding domain-containing protein [Candidatus Omnitrophica bacterium]|nr:transporter substrate-binding domain-containing protein [Candidatus Omnitrophota bacterium]
MKAQGLRTGVLSLLMLVFLMVFAVRTYADTIVVRADSWPPYNADPAASEPGYVVEILKAVFEPQGHKIDYQTMPWTRAVADMMEGKVDAIIGASHADAPDALYPAESMGVILNAFFVKKDSTWKYSGVDSLKTIKLGVIDGYPYDDDGAIDKYIKAGADPEVQVMTGDGSLERNIKKLQAGRLDAVVENEIVMEATLKNMGIAAGEIVNAGKADEQKDLFVAFTPNKDTTKKYSQLWDEGIKKLRESGELKKILDRYSVKDWR